MRIAIATVEYAGAGMVDGGLANYLNRLSSHLVSRGHSVEVFVCHPVCLPTSEDRHWMDGGCGIHLLSAFRERPSCLDGAEMSPELRNDLAAAWRIGRCLGERHAAQPFDIIHASNWGVPTLFMDAQAPIVLRLSSYSPLLRVADSLSLDTTRLAHEMLERIVIREADVCYAPSQLIAGYVERTLGVPVSQVWPPAFIETPFETFDQDWLSRATAGASPYFLYAGSLNRLKGCAVFGQALPAVLEACPDVHVHMVGRDYGGWSWITPVAERYPGRIHYHGVLPHARLYPLMREALAVVAPYLVDNLANVLIEALLLGVPAIGTQGTSGDELLGPSGGGYLVPPGDAAALADAMMRMARIPVPDRRQMGARGQQWISTELHPDKALDQLEQLFVRARAQPTTRRVPGEVALRCICEDLAGQYAFVSSADADARLAAKEGRLLEMEAVMRSRKAAVKTARLHARDWELRYRQLAMAFPVRQLRWLNRKLKTLGIP